MTPEQERAKFKRYYDRVKNTPEYRARQSRNQRKYYSDPCLRAARLARKKARHAVRIGKLARQPCSICQSTKAEMHHSDYLKPLDVTWLCRGCHQQAHRHSTVNSKLPFNQLPNELKISRAEHTCRVRPGTIPPTCNYCGKFMRASPHDRVR